VAELAEAFFGGAMEVIRQKLEDGDLRAAIFVAGRYMDAAADSVSYDLQLPKDATPIQIGQRIIAAMTDGHVPVAQAERMMRVLERATAMEHGTQLEEIRAMIDRLEGGQAKVVQGEVLSPAWGRLREEANGNDRVGSNTVVQTNGNGNGAAHET
jgi:hypothetical protein